MTPGRRRAGPIAPILTALLAAAVSACASTATTNVRQVTPTTPISAAPTTATPTTATSSPTTTSTIPSAVPTTVPTPVVSAIGWSLPVPSLPPAGGFTSLSCISEVFCLAAGGGSNEADADDSVGPGVVASWDGATWSPPVTYYGASPGSAPPPWMPAISCTDGPLCAVVDGSAHASLGDGTNWWPPVSLAASPAPSPTPSPAPTPNPADPGNGHSGSRTAAVSCPTSHFCAYVDNTGQVATLHGSTWSALQVFTTSVGTSTVDLFQTGRVAVSCSTVSSCTALVGDTELDWDGTSWSASPGPWGTATPTGDIGLSCPANDACTAVHGSTASVRIPGSGWSTPRVIDGNGGLDAVDCPTTTSCMAADAYGNVLRLSGGSWSAPQKVVPTPSAYTGDGTSLSCPTDDFCMVITGDGEYATYHSAAPSASTTYVPATSVTAT